MKTFTDSAANILDIATTVAAEVDLILANQTDGQRLNVKEYSERMQAERGWNALFVATLVRTIVNECGEYESIVGRFGGVGRVAGVKSPKRSKTAPVETAVVPATEEISVATETVAEPFELSEALKNIAPIGELATPAQEPANNQEQVEIAAEQETGLTSAQLSQNETLFADNFNSADEWLDSLSA